MQFSGITFTMLYNHHHYFWNIFITSNRNSITINQELPIPPLSQPLVTTVLLPIYTNLYAAAAAAAKSLQLCPTLCDPIDGSPPGSTTPGILQARTLEWVAISFSNAWKWKMKVKSLSHVQLFPTPWTAAYQAPPSWDFPGKRTGVGCHCLLHMNLYGII